MAKDQADVTDDELNTLSAEERAAIQDPEASDEAAALEAVIGDDDDAGEDGAANATGEDGANGDANADGDAKNDGEGKPKEGAAADDSASEEDAGGDAGAEEEVLESNVNQLAVLPVEDYDKKMQAFQNQKIDLRKQLDDGDIELSEYEAKKDEITRQETDLLIKQNAAINAAEQNEHMAKKQWEREQRHFFSRPENKIYDDKYIGAALNQAVKDLANDPKNADKPGSFFLQEADRLIRERFGKPLAKKPDQQRKPDLGGLPKTLSNIPAAETNDTAAEFAHLENLSGIELEQALARLPKEQADRYLRT